MIASQAGVRVQGPSVGRANGLEGVGMMDGIGIAMM